MQITSFSCDCCDERHYELNIPTDECFVTRQVITVELPREGIESLLEMCQRALLNIPDEAVL